MGIPTMHAYADLLARSNVGYDQGDRWSFDPSRDGRTVIPGTECDCSSSCAAIARAGGYPLDMRDPLYTGNLRERLVAAGWSAIAVAGWAASRLYPALRAGDMLLGPGHVVYVRTPDRWWSAETDERGRSAGGRAGDQTGREARYRAPYMRSRGWEWILRPLVDADPYNATTPRDTNIDMEDDMALTDIEQRDLMAAAYRVLGGIPAGSAEARLNPDGTPARVLDSADGDYLRVMIEAQTAAIRALAGAMGADPDQITAAVRDGVKAALDGLRITLAGGAA